MSQTRDRISQTPADRAAADWVARHDAGLTPEEQARFADWLAADPRHQEVFDRWQARWSDLDLLEDLRPAGAFASTPDSDLLAPRRKAKRTALLFPLVLAAAAAIALALFISRSTRVRATDLIAAVDPVIPQARRFLADGSVVDLAAHTSLEVTFAPERRIVRLTRGEAHFSVAKDAQRPFVVEIAGWGTVRAVGTAFDVRLASGQVDVRVTEGTVRIDTLPGPVVPALTAGQRLRAPLPLDAAAMRIEASSVATASPDLRPARYEFEAAPLSRVVAEFNRQAHAPVVIDDPALRDLRVYVSFAPDHLDSFVHLLAASGEVEVVPQADATHLRLPTKNRAAPAPVRL